MTNPGEQDGLEAEFEALRRDARSWHEASQALAEPTAQIAGLTVPPAAFSLLGEAQGVPAAYDAIQQRVPELLGQARQVTAGLGDTLVAAANTYQREDREAAARIAEVPPGSGGG